MNTIANLTPLLQQRRPDASDTDRGKQVHAAQDFESLLIGQMLHSMRENGSGWLGTGEDEAGGTAIGYGEEQLAQALAKAGGLGLSRLIAQGLARPATTTPLSTNKS